MNSDDMDRVLSPEHVAVMTGVLELCLSAARRSGHDGIEAWWGAGCPALLEAVADEFALPLDHPDVRRIADYFITGCMAWEVDE